MVAAQRRPFLAPGLAALLALAGCGSGDSPTSGDSSAPTQAQSAALQEVNRLRLEAQLPRITFRQALNVAAVKHAGYQAIEFGGAVNLTHYETIDHQPGSADDSTNPLFIAARFDDRIRAANGGANLFVSYVYYEGITSVYPPAPAIRSLWNTVYHRLPMCRRETTQFGFGDAANARLIYPDRGVPPSTFGYSTCEFAGPGTTTTTSTWPPHGNTLADASFSTDSEVPDPIDPGNPYQSHPLAAHNAVGTPIHLFAPFAADWSAVTVTFREQGVVATLPVYVIAGFRKGAGDPHDHTANPFPTKPAGISTFDSLLDEGELFILPQAPLTAGVTYEVSITATAGTDTALVGDPTPVAFTPR